jgi:hypothetical protein
VTAVSVGVVSLGLGLGLGLLLTGCAGVVSVLAFGAAGCWCWCWCWKNRNFVCFQLFALLPNADNQFVELGQTQFYLQASLFRRYAKLFFEGILLGLCLNQN